MKQFILAAAILAAFSISADAQTRTPVIREKAFRQNSRIHQGQRNGSLTRAEAMRLHRQQRLIHRDLRMARADGHVSARERAIIRQRQAIANRNIYRQKHDYQYHR